MRFYRLTITDLSQLEKKKTTRRRFELRQEQANPPFLIASYVRRDPNGPGWLPGFPTDRFDPGALEIQFQVTQNSLTTFETGGGGVAITIKGVDLTTVKKASNLVGRLIRLEVGMGVGLHICRPEQAGQILEGTITSAVGNWEGTDISLTLYAMPYVILPGHQEALFGKDDNGDLVRTNHLQFHCQRGADLITATQNALRNVAPNYEFVSRLRGQIPASQEVHGSYSTVKELCVGMRRAWLQASGRDIAISIRSRSFVLSDLEGSNNPKKPIQIRFIDLIGQPCWEGVSGISFTCPLRGDIKVLDQVILPEGLEGFGRIAGDGSTTILAPRNRNLFSGTFTVLKISHLGQFRSTDGRQWASTFFCVPATTGKKS